MGNEKNGDREGHRRWGGLGETTDGRQWGKVDGVYGEAMQGGRDTGAGAHYRQWGKMDGVNSERPTGRKWDFGKYYGASRGGQQVVEDESIDDVNNWLADHCDLVRPNPLEEGGNSASDVLAGIPYEPEDEE